jgi:hypothetical protein
MQTGLQGVAILMKLKFLYSQTLALTWTPSGGRSVGIVRSRTQAKEFSSIKKLHLRNGRLATICMQLIQLEYL